MKDNLFTRTGYFTRGLSLIWKPGIMSFTLWPILITLVVFITLASVGIGYFELVMERFLPSGEVWILYFRSPFFSWRITHNPLTSP